MRVPTKTQSYLRNASVEAVSDSETVTIPAGAAGTLVDFSISKHPIANAGGTDLGGAGDTSLAISAGDELDTEVGKKTDADLANGEFYIDYLTGKGRGRKATAGVSTGFTFKVFKLMVGGVTLETGDIEIGAVEIKNATDDTRATVGANGLHVDLKTLPPDAATQTTLALIKAKTDNLDVLLSTLTTPLDTQPVSGTFWQATQPISAATLPLPTGASTSDNQSTANAALAAIQTAIEILDNIVSGAEAQVDIVTLPADNLGQQLMAASLSTVPASDIADATYIGDIKFGEPLPAGTNAIGKLSPNSGVDIGDVDILTLPAGNIGQQAMAASLSVVPASDIADATYIGDIKFGEPLPAGTNDVGNVGHGKTIKSVTGTVAADTDIVAAVPGKKIKVIAFELISDSITANTITFQSNATTALRTIPLQALAGTIAGAANGVPAPSFLFETAVGEKLTLDVSAAVNVTYNVTYFDSDAS